MNKRLFVFSVDAMVTEDVDALRSMPNLQKYLAGGSEYKGGMRTIYPSVTYPAHVSILTGCYAGKHGITSNFDFTTTNKDDSWLWFSDRIQVEDIFAVAKKAGLKTASVSWPVTGCNPNVDYLIDEYWMPLPGDTQLPPGRQQRRGHPHHGEPHRPAGRGLGAGRQEALHAVAAGGSLDRGLHL